MPYLLRHLLLAATPANARRIIAEIREQLKFVGFSNVRVTQGNKLKGKLNVENVEASILNALKSSLRFKNVNSTFHLHQMLLIFCVYWSFNLQNESSLFLLSDTLPRDTKRT